MNKLDWADSIGAAVTVCDANGKILYLNQQSATVFEKYGDIELVGKSLFDCHAPESVKKINELLQSGRSNHYTIQKNGCKKMVYQTPFFDNGKIAGLVEISFVIPDLMRIIS